MDLNESVKNKIENGDLSNQNDDQNNYDTVFPSLPSIDGNVANNVWGNSDNRLSIKRHLTTTQVFHVPVEERRYKDVASFGNANETNKKCEDIAKRCGVKVELCCSKDQSLHIVITGQEEKVLEAKRAIISELQTKSDSKIKVSKEQHKFLIGKGGAVLKDLQERTCTTIQIPKSDQNSDLITITGPKDGIDQAIHEIQLIVEEQSKTGLERLNIPKLYHPWIRGFNNEIANEISNRTGAKINIPPPLIENDEIAISGEKEKVDLACSEIKRIYNEKSKLKIQKLSIQITKSQHKLIIGKNGSGVQEIFRDFDVYVQVPKLDSPSETIFLFGEESKIGAALSQVCAKANSIVNTKIEAPSWLHRYMIGEKGSNISKITADYPNTHVKFEQDNKITLDGPPDEVEKVKEILQNITIGLKQSMICEEITVDPKYYPQLIGKKSENISRLNKEYGVLVRVPPENSNINQIRIEGAPDAVQKAKTEFLELLKKVENERSKDIIIEQKYHSNLIGKNGKNLSEIRSKFNDVQIIIPNQEDKSDVVTIRGNKLDVEKCYKHLQQLYQQSNYQEDIHIFRQFHGIIIGKEGAFIKKIRDDTQTRIEVPAIDSGSDSITLIGKQEDVVRAKKLIEEKVKEIVKIEEDTVDIPHALHTALIGKGGAIIKNIRSECGGVIINFPPETTPSDKITLKGPRDEIEKAKKQLLKLAKDKNELSYSEEVHAKLEYHKFLVGKKGNNINQLRDAYNVRILFPSSSNSSNQTQNGSSNGSKELELNDIITILGKEENVKAAKAKLETIIKTLDEQISEDVIVDPKWHKSFTAKRAKMLTKISEENCNVKISFPKTPNSNIVTVKGPRDAVEAAKKRILDAVYEFENQVTIEVVIPQKYHVSIIGKKGASSQLLSDEYKVEIQFPAKSTAAAGEENLNENKILVDHNDDDISNTNTASPSKSDIVLITGLKEDCEKAKEAMLALLPVTENFEFPFKFHKDLLENKAEFLKNVYNKINVNVNLPDKSKNSNFISLVGPKDKIDEAKSILSEKLNELELKNFKVEIENIRPELIPQLRGRNGSEVRKLENKFQLRIEFSRKGEPDKIVIKGYQKNVLECEEYIRNKIKEDESKISQEIQIDNRVHSRIIGSQGKSLAKIIEKFKVDIKFAGRSNDTVIVKGDSQDAVDDACDHLKNLEEEYLQDVIDKEAYTHPSSKTNENEKATNGSSKGFVVRGAPWEQQQNSSNSVLNPNEPPPDTTNMDDFPTITSAVTGPSASQKMIWGPSRK